ncbi:uncharacterized protein LOC135389419 [Ornithodoros turicata]|uniref:uncharacterized protein LOC135389419 n=1 Tax=Ornithodoros turicata TaxID=34597 RepID=UPI00313957D0
MMFALFKDCSGVKCYLDDIIVFGVYEQDHLEHLYRVLQLISDAGLKLNDKCVFGVRELTFVGHTVRPNGISPNLANLQAIQDAATPDYKTLSSFLAMMGYYAEFIKNYADEVEPRQKLLYGEMHRFSGPRRVSTDASAYSLRAVLQQQHGSYLKTVAFASRTLSAAERRYFVGEREALACVWAVEYWHVYLWGRRFTQQTDHQTLQVLLSRQESLQDEEEIICWIDSTGSGIPSRQELQAELYADPLLAQILKFIQQGWPSRNTMSQNFSAFGQVKDELSEVAGLLLSTVTSATVISFLRTLFSREGYPTEIVSDHGPQFTSSDFQEFLNDRSIKHTYSSIYHPQSNDLIERFNRVLKSFIQVAFLEKRSLEAALTDYLGVYHATPHTTTGYSPAVLLHGCALRTRLNVVGLPIPDFHVDPVVALQNLREKILKKQLATKKYVDNKRAAHVATLKVGDFVRVKQPTHVRKGGRLFSTPRMIVASQGSSSFLLDDGKIWNASRLYKVSEEASHKYRKNVHHQDEVHWSLIDPPQLSMLPVSTDRKASTVDPPLEPVTSTSTQEPQAKWQEPLRRGSREKRPPQRLR